MHIKHLIFLMVLSTILVHSCAEDESGFITEIETVPEEVGYDGVDEALWVYFERFEAEAAERGFTIDLNSGELTGRINELDGENVAGQCNYHSFFPNRITIDSDFWDRASDAAREMVVFHELGHCELARGHREDANGRGLCLSIMRSGTGDCRVFYNTNREAYLDELFDTTYFDTIGDQ